VCVDSFLRLLFPEVSLCCLTALNGPNVLARSLLIEVMNSLDELLHRIGKCFCFGFGLGRAMASGVTFASGRGMPVVLGGYLWVRLQFVARLNIQDRRDSDASRSESASTTATLNHRII
jgi:hypothetical protein